WPFSISPTAIADAVDVLPTPPFPIVKITRVSFEEKSSIIAFKFVNWIFSVPRLLLSNEDSTDGLSLIHCRRFPTPVNKYDHYGNEDVSSSFSPPDIPFRAFCWRI